MKMPEAVQKHIEFEATQEKHVVDVARIAIDRTLTWVGIELRHNGLQAEDKPHEPKLRAITKLRECADALDSLPPQFRRTSMFGPFISTQTLREEADWLENIFNEMARLLAELEDQ